MEMGTGLGSLPFFAVTWTVMMAAMMLPSALPAALGLDGIAPLGFAASYVAVWSLVGLARTTVVETERAPAETEHHAALE